MLVRNWREPGASEAGHPRPPPVPSGLAGPTSPVRRRGTQVPCSAGPGTCRGGAQTTCLAQPVGGPGVSATQPQSHPGCCDPCKSCKAQPPNPKLSGQAPQPHSCPRWAPAPTWDPAPLPSSRGSVRRGPEPSVLCRTQQGPRTSRRREPPPLWARTSWASSPDCPLRGSLAASVPALNKPPWLGLPPPGTATPSPLGTGLGPLPRDPQTPLGNEPLRQVTSRPAPAPWAPTPPGHRPLLLGFILSQWQGQLPGDRRLHCLPTRVASTPSLALGNCSWNTEAWAVTLPSER